MWAPRHSKSMPWARWMYHWGRTAFLHFTTICMSYLFWFLNCIITSDCFMLVIMCLVISVPLKCPNAADWWVVITINLYKGGPKYFRNLHLPHERDIVQGSATRYSKPTIFWTSLPSDISLRASCQFFWYFFYVSASVFGDFFKNWIGPHSLERPTVFG
jgi:hypothetical protein